MMHAIARHAWDVAMELLEGEVNDWLTFDVTTDAWKCARMLVAARDRPGSHEVLCAVLRRGVLDATLGNEGDGLSARQALWGLGVVLANVPSDGVGVAEIRAAVSVARGLLEQDISSATGDAGPARLVDVVQVHGQEEGQGKGQGKGKGNEEEPSKEKIPRKPSKKRAIEAVRRSTRVRRPPRRI